MANPVLALLARRQDVLVTLRSPQDCADRLRQTIDGNFAILGSRPVIGSVHGTTATLRKRIGYRNSFQTAVRLSLEAGPRGTEITCRSGMSLFTTVFMLFWFGFLGVFLGIGTTLAEPTTKILFGLAPIGMAAFGVALVLFGRYLARDEHDAVVAFVSQTLEAAPLQTNRQSGRPIVS